MSAVGAGARSANAGDGAPGLAPLARPGSATLLFRHPLPLTTCEGRGRLFSAWKRNRTQATPSEKGVSLPPP